VLAPLVGLFLSMAYIAWATRRYGYFARPGEVGFVGITGRLTAFRQPTVRFHRFTATNWRHLRLIGLGQSVSVPVIVGVNAAGKRSLALSPFLYP
jgi:hypothetical protein